MASAKRDYCLRRPLIVAPIPITAIIGAIQADVRWALGLRILGYIYN